VVEDLRNNPLLASRLFDFLPTSLQSVKTVELMSFIGYAYKILATKLKSLGFTCIISKPTQGFFAFERQH
jgi:hypothetical protein